MLLWAKGSALPQQAEPARKPHTKMQRTKAQVPAMDSSAFKSRSRLNQHISRMLRYSAQKYKCRRLKNP